MKKVIKIASTTFLILLALAAALVIFFIFQSKGNIEKAPDIFGYKPLTILSNSMQPVFDAGDVILINVNKEPKEGDVITFKHPDGVLVTHRAVRTFEKDGTTYFETKGDNNEHVDEVITSEVDILGVQEKIIPFAGYVAKFATGPIGFSLLIVVPLVIFLILEIFQRLGLVGNKKKEQIQA